MKGNLSGPVGIVKEFAVAAKAGLPAFIEMTALISTLLRALQPAAPARRSTAAG